MHSLVSLFVVILFAMPLVTTSAGAQQQKVRVLLQGNPMDYVAPFVVNGSVKYAQLNKAKLKKLVNVFALRCSTLPTDKPALGYLVDLYNSACIYNVLRHDNLQKPTDVKDFFTEKFIPWGTDRISLNTLENDVIRPRFNEPLVHFVLVCAARGCPPLMGSPLGGQSEQEIMRRLRQSTKAYLSSPQGLSIEGNRVYVSKIFDWYRVDFGGTDAEILKFIANYTPKEVSALLLSASAESLSWIEYDWTLNAFENGL